MGDAWARYRELTEATPGADVGPLRDTAIRVEGALPSLDAACTALPRLGGCAAVGRTAPVLAEGRRRSAGLAHDITAAIALVDGITAARERVRGNAVLVVRPLVAALRILPPEPVAALRARVDADLAALRLTFEADLATITRRFELLTPEGSPNTAGPTSTAPGAPGAASSSPCGAPTGPGPLVVPAAARGSAIPGPSAPPREVALWWGELPPATRADLLGEAPDALAGLHGLPAPDVDRLLRTRLARAASDPDPAISGPAGATLDVLAEVARDSPSGAGAPLLLAWTPGTPGGIAIGWGDPGIAEHVAWVVPGTGSDPLRDVSRHGADRVAALYREMASRSGSVAVVQWLDADLPDAPTDARVVAPGLAERAGRRLADDVAGFAASAGEAAGTRTVTLVGHSYGSTIAGIAARETPVDHVVLLGSPGAGVDHAADLRGARVWAGADEHDPVVALTRGGWFDASPGGTAHSVYEPGFGATVFEADTGASARDAHSGYFGGAVPAIVAAIATGGDDVPPATGVGPGGTAVAQAAESASELWEDLGEIAADVREARWREARDHLADAGGELAADALDIAAGTLGDLWSAATTLRWP